MVLKSKDSIYFNLTSSHILLKFFGFCGRDVIYGVSVDVSVNVSTTVTNE